MSSKTIYVILLNGILCWASWGGYRNIQRCHPWPPNNSNMMMITYPTTNNLSSNHRTSVGASVVAPRRLKNTPSLNLRNNFAGIDSIDSEWFQQYIFLFSIIYSYSFFILNSNTNKWRLHKIYSLPVLYGHQR